MNETTGFNCMNFLKKVEATPAKPTPKVKLADFKNYQNL
jgi:hypothetical protein